MAKFFSNQEAAQKIRKIVYAKADAHGYINKNRNENGKFMNDLVEDPEVGGVLSEYMEKGKIRTYIKDTLLNAYSKSRKGKMLEGNSPVDTIQKVYSTLANIIQDEGNVSVCRSDNGKIFVISSGELLKWETALRKALEIVARQPNLTVDEQVPEMCLQLVIKNLGVTDGDKKLVVDALKAINVKVRFCGM
jgi:hypothetical protein